MSKSSRVFSFVPLDFFKEVHIASSKTVLYSTALQFSYDGTLDHVELDKRMLCRAGKLVPILLSIVAVCRR